MGVFEQKSNDQFAITPLSLPLTSDHPSTLRSFAIMHGEEWHWKSWGQLYESVKTGRPGIELEYGEDVFSYLAKHSAASENFNQTMEDLTTTMTDAIIQAYDFSKHAVIADVGGSYGQLLSAILKSAPHAKGILFDLPDVITKAETRLKEQANDPVIKRISCQKGSFFESFPDSAEIYILKWILHD